MEPATITIKNGTIALPKQLQKAWQGTKAFIESLDRETVLIRKVEADKPVYDFDDASVWKDMMRSVRTVRKQLFKERYPSLYAKYAKRRKKKA